MSQIDTPSEEIKENLSYRSNISQKSLGLDSYVVQQKFYHFDSSKQKIRQLFTSFYIIFLTISVILILVYGRALGHSFVDYSKDFIYMMENWKSDFITDIYVRHPDQKCDKGDTYLFSYQFKGTKEGCLCDNQEISPFPCCNFADSDNHHSSTQEEKETYNHTEIFFNANGDNPRSEKMKMQMSRPFLNNQLLNHNHTLDQQGYQFKKLDSLNIHHDRVHSFGNDIQKMRQTNCKCYGESIPPLEGKTFNIWGNRNKTQPGGVIYCAKRSKGSSFYNLGVNNGTCLKNQTFCGQEGQETETTFCMPKGSKCPITDIAFGGQSPPEGDFDQEEPIQIIDGEYLFISRSYSKYPLVQLRVSEGDGVCLRNKIFNGDKVHPIYPLWNTDLPQCGGIDRRFERMDQMTEEDYLKLNQFEHVMYDKSRFYPEINKQNQISLFARNVISLELKCREKMQLIHKIVGEISYLQSYVQQTSNFSILVFFSSILVLTLNIFILFQIHSDFDWYSPSIYHRKQVKHYWMKSPELERSDKADRVAELKKNFKFFWFKYLNLQYINIVLQFCLFVMMITLKYQFEDITAFATDFDTSQCSDKKSVKTVLNLKFSFNTLYLNRLIWIIVLNFILDPNLTYKFQFDECHDVKISQKKKKASSQEPTALQPI